MVPVVLVYKGKRYEVRQMQRVPCVNEIIHLSDYVWTYVLDVHWREDGTAALHLSSDLRTYQKQ